VDGGCILVGTAPPEIARRFLPELESVARERRLGGPEAMRIIRILDPNEAKKIILSDR
jgi:hypothetical protein